MKKEEIIIFSWTEKVSNTSCIQSCYCFHNCDVNRY